MKLLRSWPAEIPEGRSYVNDGIERLVMTGYDYRCLADVDDDVCLIEWDIAIGGDELAEFMRRAAAEPDRVRVAPYILYPTPAKGLAHGVWAHRVRLSGRTNRWVNPDDPVCQIFGFGLAYLPRQLVLDFVSMLRPRDRFSDATFSEWHCRQPIRDVPIDWDCRAVHLHYERPEVPAAARGTL